VAEDDETEEVEGATQAQVTPAGPVLRTQVESGGARRSLVQTHAQVRFQKHPPLVPETHA
jgi:hypothetical protein